MNFLVKDALNCFNADAERLGVAEAFVALQHDTEALGGFEVRALRGSGTLDW